MPIIDIVTLSIGFISIIFPAILYFRNKKSNVGKSLLFLSLVSGPIWSLAIWGYNQNYSVSVDIFFLNIIYLVSILTAFSTYWLTNVFPYKAKVKFWETILVFGLGTFFIYEIYFTNNFVKNIIYNADGSRIPQLGHLYIFWFFWFAILFLWRTIQMRQKMSSLGGIEKKQISYIISGFTIVGFGVIPTNMIFPYFGHFEFIWIGPIFIAIMIALIAYGMSTTRFINFRNLIQKILLIIKAVFIPILTGILLLLIFHNIFSISLLISSILSSLISVSLTFFIIRKNYENRKDLSSMFLSQTSSQLNLDEIGNSLSHILKSNIACLGFNYVVLDKYKKLIYSFQKSLPVDYILLNQYWAYHDDYSKLIVLAELEYLKVLSIEENNIWKYKRFISLVEYLKRFKWQLVLPISLENGKLAIIFVGNHNRNSIFSNAEVNSLLELRSAINVTLDRGLLHQKTEDFNISLKQKVSEQTFELQEQVKELEEARRKETDMIDIMGHELRTPMSVIKLNIDLLHNFSVNITKKKELFTKYISRIKDATETEINLINTLLSSAKLEGDKIELNLERVDINKEINMSIHAHGVKAEQKKLELIYTQQLDNPYVYADHARVVEILNNLISNAVKYTNQGSVKVKTENKDDFIKISVIDTGRGISKEDITKLGSKFYRASTYIESKDSDNFDIVRPGGTGLGLYVTFNLVKKMGGDIYVESKLGKGSNFTFTLPVYTNQNGNQDENHDSKDRFIKAGLKE